MNHNHIQDTHLPQLLFFFINSKFRKKKLISKFHLITVDSSDATDLRFNLNHNHLHHQQPLLYHHHNHQYNSHQIKATDNQMHNQKININNSFDHLENEKFQLNYAAHLRNMDTTSPCGGGGVGAGVSSDGGLDASPEMEYIKNLKENNKYFIDGNYPPTNRDFFPNNNDNHLNKETTKVGHAVYDENTNEFDDSISNNGDSVKDLSPVGLKRKSFDDDYLKNFESIRARNFDEMQQQDSAKHQRLASGGGAGGGANEYRGIGMMEQNKLGDDNDSNVNYASSEDLNQTNSIEGGEKITSGSDDEGGNFEFFSIYFINCNILLFLF